jgi:hypothetical protein
MVVTILSIHNRDEVHQIIAFLSMLITLICTFILAHVIIKILVTLFFFISTNIIFSDYKNLSK